MESPEQQLGQLDSLVLSTEGELPYIGENPITNCVDGFNEHLGTRTVFHKKIGRVRLSKQRFAENKVPIGRTRTLCFVNRLAPRDALIVAFHGAHVRSKPVLYPRYERVRTLQGMDASFMCFADPTAQHHPNVLLSWYLGDEHFDPMDGIDRIIDQAVKRTGARKVIFLGGSGGGFAALRACLRRPGSAAFVESPRVDLRTASPRSLEKYLSRYWPGRSLEHLMAEYPDRFDLLSSLRTNRTDQRFYFLQGLFDPKVLWDSYRLAKNSFSVSEVVGSSFDGLAHFALFESREERHGPPPRSVFLDHWNRAMKAFDVNAPVRKNANPV